MDASKPLSGGGMVASWLSGRAARVFSHPRAVSLCLFLLLHILAVSPSAYAQVLTPRISSLEVNGNESFPAYRIFERLSLAVEEPYSDVSLRSAMDALSAFYHDEGYLAAVIRAGLSYQNGDSSRIDIRVRIEEGPLCIVGEIEFEGNAAFTSDRLREMMDTRPGAVLRQPEIGGDIESIVSLYEENGYPFAAASVRDVAFTSDSGVSTTRVQIVIDEGSYITVNEMRVLGARNTSTSVIVRESGIRLGDPFNQNRVMAIPGKLSRLNIFARVEEPELYITDGGGGLSIVVEEGNANTFDGVLGYVPSADRGGKGYLTGLINVTMRNLFGTARRVQVRWQREDRVSQELGLRYLEPWIFGLPVDLSGGFSQRQQDSSYIRREYELTGSLRVATDVRIAGNLQAGSVIPSATLSGKTVMSSSTILAGAEVLVDTRDDAVTPVSGILFRNGFGIGAKRSKRPGENSTNTSTMTVRRYSLDIDYFISPFRRQVIALGVHGREIDAGTLEAADLYRFGGSTTLRGFRENQFEGSRIAWASAEYRFLLSRRSFFFGFIDGGYYYLPAGIGERSESEENIRSGYGFGIRLETGVGLLGVSFALGNGDALGEGKIHIGIINEF